MRRGFLSSDEFIISENGDRPKLKCYVIKENNKVFSELYVDGLLGKNVLVDGKIVCCNAVEKMGVPPWSQISICEYQK